MLKAINVYPRLFGGPMRAGDLIAACNFLEFIRIQLQEPDLLLYVPDESIFDSEHCHIMRNFLVEKTSYMTVNPNVTLKNLEVVPGTDPTYNDMFNLWNIRKDVAYQRQNVFEIPDAVKIPNNKPEQKQVVIVPLFDAPYNKERNWQHIDILIHFMNKHINPNVPSYVVAKEPIRGLNLKNFEYSFDYRKSLDLIMNCTHFYGGDTGLSHFASALEYRPECLFLYSRRTYGTTFPFYWREKGRIDFY